MCIRDSLPELIRFLGDLEASGEKAVILAVAGLSAALPGVVVMSCSLPVIGDVYKRQILRGPDRDSFFH